MVHGSFSFLAVSPLLSRVGRFVAIAAAVCCGTIATFPAGAQITPPLANTSPASLVDDLQKRGFDYFWFESHPQTGLVKDRAGNLGPDESTVTSLAATGFGLAVLPIGVERGWITREQGVQRAELTLKFVREKLHHEHGWLYHFVDGKTGERVWKCEISSIDTALFLAGALLAGQYFEGEVKALSDALYRRVDFQWMLTDGGARPDEKLLSHGWKPETGFLKSRWDNYSEHLLLNILALASPTHPVPSNCWDAWERNIGEYRGFKTFKCGPLFTHQYSQAFLDFRGKQDHSGYDYFETAVQATKANRQFCIDQMPNYKTYGSNVWGLSACDRPGGGYEAYGAPPGVVHHDGTVAPWATVAAIAFTPDLALDAIHTMDRQFRKRLWGRYGFSDGFNVDRDWFANDVIGIDLGAAVLLIENYRTGKVWRWFAGIPEIKSVMERTFVPTKTARPAPVSR
jgi:hypothetical protein